jgi:hypothetical protein
MASHSVVCATAPLYLDSSPLEPGLHDPSKVSREPALVRAQRSLRNDTLQTHGAGLLEQRGAFAFVMVAELDWRALAFEAAVVCLEVGSFDYEAVRAPIRGMSEVRQWQCLWLSWKGQIRSPSRRK